MPKNKRSQRPRVALAVIARDEEQFIADCLDSARPYVDDVVVLDTGSTDRTVEIARAHGARVEHFTWCDDFSAARNAAIDATHADWVLMLDADERLVPESGPLLRQLPPLLPADCHGYTMRIDSVHVADTGEMASADKIPRFFPRRADVRWLGRIHEDLRYIPDPSRTRLIGGTGLRAIHFGYDPGVYATRGKDARNLAILDHAREQDPADARMIFFTGQQHMAMKRWSEAVRFFEDFLGRQHSLPSSFAVEAFNNLLVAQFELRESNGLRRTAALAEARGALSAMGYMALGQEAESRGDAAQAREYYERTLDSALPTGFTWDAAVGGWMSYVRMAMAEVLRERFDDALQLFDKALLAAPLQQVANLVNDSVRIALRANRPDDAERALRAAAELTRHDFDQQLRLVHLGIDVARATPNASLALPGSCRRIEQAFALEDWQMLYEATLALDLTAAGALAHIVAAAASLREQGAADAALDLLSRGMDISAASEQFYLLLVQALRDLGRFDEAVEVLNLLQSIAAPQYPAKTAA